MLIFQLEWEISGAKKFSMKRAGHCMNMDKPKEFNRIVKQFIEDFENCLLKVLFILKFKKMETQESTITGTGEIQNQNNDIIREEDSSNPIVADFEKERAAVSERIDQWFRAIDLKDAEMLEEVICDDPGMLFFGTDVQERWIGRDDFIAAQKDFFIATSNSRIDIYNKTIQISNSGTVAWTSCMMDWDIMAGEQPIHLEGLRLTSVFEKREGKWVLVQGHGSQPVSGQMVAY
jgi:ketosteroid isomerase-like protein